MTYLWANWPQPVRAGAGSPDFRAIFAANHGWELVADGFQSTEGPCANADGVVYFNDVPAGITYRIGSDGKPEKFVENAKRGDGQAFGPDGRLYQVAAGTSQILAYPPSGQPVVIADGFKGNDLVVRHDGGIYVTAPYATGKDNSEIYFIAPDGTKRVVDQGGLKFCNGVTLSPDQSLLYVADSRSHWVYSYQVQPDGSLKHKQKFFHLHMPDSHDEAGADGLRVDRNGMVYVATKLGIQICDPVGRVHCIIPTPNGKISNLTFGGPEFDVLYATCGNAVYRRKLATRGAPAFLPPFKHEKPRL
jgi:sugar lactone lactonase YvrE